jgi:hypothetical protein
MQRKIEVIELDVVLKLLEQFSEQAAHATRSGHRISRLEQCLVVT